MSSKTARREKELNSKIDQLEKMLKHMERLLIQNEELTRKVEQQAALLQAARPEQELFPWHKLSRQRRFMLKVIALFFFGTIIFFWGIVEPVAFIFMTPWFSLLATLFTTEDTSVSSVGRPRSPRERMKRLLSLLGIRPRGRDSP